MKLLIRWLTIIAACLLAGEAVADPIVKAGPVVVFGDSLSAGYGLHPGEGWVALLEQKLQRAGYGQKVVNASVSGETTTGGRARIGRVLATHHPSVLVLELGANDALRGLPPSGIEENLISIIESAAQSGARVLVVGTPIPGNYGEEYARAVAQAYQNASRRTRTPIVPSLIAGISTSAENFQSDRLHPVAAVQAQMLDAVWPLLRPLLPKIPH